MRTDEKEAKTGWFRERRLFIACWALWSPLLLAADGKKIGLDKLDGPTGARVLVALAGLVILWFAVIALVWLGARATRRYMKSHFDEAPRRPVSELAQDEWATKPMVPTEEIDENNQDRDER